MNPTKLSQRLYEAAREGYIDTLLSLLHDYPTNEKTLDALEEILEYSADKLYNEQQDHKDQYGTDDDYDDLENNASDSRKNLYIFQEYRNKLRAGNTVA
jgi:hypothetical protein